MKKPLAFIITAILIASQFALGQIQYVHMDVQSKWEQDFDGITKIKVHWENAGSNYSQEKLWVEEALNETWEEFANVDFYGWNYYNNSKKGIRVFVDNYARPNCKGLGKNIDGVASGMVLNFEFLGSFTCNNRTRKHCIKAIAVHEFGHALGLPHQQDRTNCQCEKSEDVPSGNNTTSLISCDTNSVMNYCNEKWINDGKLSNYDIEGIQAIYGKNSKHNAPKKIITTGNLSITDELATDQLWENLDLTLAGTKIAFTLDETNSKEIKQVSITESGFYAYEIASKTLRENKQIYKGHGSGEIYLDKNKNYNIAIYMDEYGVDSLKVYLSAQEIAQ